MVNPSDHFPDFEHILARSGLTDVPGGEQTLARLLNTPAKVDNLVTRYASGERDFRGIQLQGVQILRNINLSGADLRQANLHSTNLTAANLSGANLEGANLSSAELGQANLSGANLTGAQLKYARLIQANLTAAILVGAALDGSNFSGCIMPDGHQDPAHERSMEAIGRFKRSAWQPVISEGGR
jgi:uncharacterized protein YjbI with pentapeptide repeats